MKYILCFTLIFALTGCSDGDAILSYYKVPKDSVVCKTVEETPFQEYRGAAKVRLKQKCVFFKNEEIYKREYDTKKELEAQL